MYAQSQSITIARDGLHIDWNIVPGPILADAVWGATHSAPDGAIDPEAAKAWTAPYISGLVITLDDRALGGVQVQSVRWPESVDAMRTGEGAIEIRLLIGWPEKLDGKHSIELHNTYLEGNSLNTFLLTAEAAFAFQQPAQNNGQIHFEVYFPPSASAGSPPPAGDGTWLQTWASGTPNLPSGFADTVSKVTAELGGASPAPGEAANPNPVTAIMTNLVKTGQFSPWFLPGAFLLSLALGGLHALTPGHGKALVGAFLVGSRGRTQDAILLGAVVTITHTGSVLGLGLVTLLASRYILPTAILPWLEVISGVLVIAFGVNLLLQRRHELAHRYPADARHDHPHHDHDHQGHTHSHPHPSGSQENLHEGAPTIRSLVSLGVSGGLVPCPDAIAILLVAVAVNRVPLGMLLIVAFSIGLALILMGIGIAMVHGMRWLVQKDWLSKFGIYAPLASAVVVVGLGAGLTVNALYSFRFSALVASAPRPSASPVQPPSTGFELRNARVLYIAPDGAGREQLFMLPLSSGKAVQYTHEPTGITGYSISPDGKTLLYSIFDATDGSSIWAMRSDGTQRYLALECPQAECDSTAWYPDGQKVAYERLATFQDPSSLPRFSIWWLDMQSGKTQPVFQDAGFASAVPSFSPDGQWLSYIATASNTLMIFNLKNGRQLSLPLGSQAAIPETWNPTGESLLFGDQAASGEPPPLHAKIYSLASGQITDLGGPDNQTDFSAVWSPNGQWIAIDRNVRSSDPSGSSNQVWLAKPDGTQAHVVLDEAHASYSSLRWSPDGAYLLYSRYVLQYSSKNPARFDVYAADIHTGATTLIVAGGDSATFLP